jgi:hypothetical protein
VHPLGVRTLTTLLAGPALAILLGLAPAARASEASDTRCILLTHEVNRYRVDLRRMGLLCDVAHRRSYDMVHARRIWHDLRPVMAALERARICWVNVGEVVAWNDFRGIDRRKAAFFVSQWHVSAPHWRVLMDRRYTRGGGSWMSGGGRAYATFYVLQLC